jgi:Tfp pilus assembly major pilin PilA
MTPPLTDLSAADLNLRSPALKSAGISGIGGFGDKGGGGDGGGSSSSPRKTTIGSPFKTGSSTGSSMDNLIAVDFENHDDDDDDDVALVSLVKDNNNSNNNTSSNNKNNIGFDMDDGMDIDVLNDENQENIAPPLGMHMHESVSSSRSSYSRRGGNMALKPSFAPLDGVADDGVGERGGHGDDDGANASIPKKAADAQEPPVAESSKDDVTAALDVVAMSRSSSSASGSNNSMSSYDFMTRPTAEDDGLATTEVMTTTTTTTMTTTMTTTTEDTQKTRKTQKTQNTQNTQDEHAANVDEQKPQQPRHYHRLEHRGERSGQEQEGAQRTEHAASGPSPRAEAAAAAAAASLRDDDDEEGDRTRVLRSRELAPAGATLGSGADLAASSASLASPAPSIGKDAALPAVGGGARAGAGEEVTEGAQAQAQEQAQARADVDDADDDADDAGFDMDDTAFSAFSAVPNADMTLFAGIGQGSSGSRRGSPVKPSSSSSSSSFGLDQSVGFGGRV